MHSCPIFSLLSDYFLVSRTNIPSYNIYKLGAFVHVICTFVHAPLRDRNSP